MVILALVTLGSASSGSVQLSGTRVSIAAASVIAFVVPIVAGLAAWESHRLQRARTGALAPVRRDLFIHLRALVGPISCGLIATFVVQVLALRGLPGTALEFLALAMPYAVLIAVAVFAHAVGQKVHIAISLPLAVVGSWFLLVFPIAIEPLWIRHLTGYITSCCDIATRLESRSLVAPMIVGSALIALSVALLSRTRATQITGGSLAVAAVIAAVSIVLPLGSEASAARPARDLVCSVTDKGEVCLWPENSGVRALVVERSSKIRDQLAGFGIDVPTRLSEQPSAGDWTFGTYSEATPGDIDLALISGLLPPFPDCSARNNEYLAGPTVAGALWILASIAGVEDAMDSVVTVDERLAVEPVLESADPAVLDWLSQTLSAISECDVAPPAFPEPSS